jgi:hypothetical protein
MSSEFWYSLVVLVGTVLSAAALRAVRRGKFFDEVFWGWPLGMYVWGDVVVLAPAWAIAGAVALLTRPNTHLVVSWFIVFHTLRSAYEVIYWLNHQATEKTFVPPLFRSQTVLSPEASAIIYQMVHFIIVVVGLGWLLFLR